MTFCQLLTITYYIPEISSFRQTKWANSTKMKKKKKTQNMINHLKKHCKKGGKKKTSSFLAFLIFYLDSKKDIWCFTVPSKKIKMAISRRSLCKCVFACPFRIFRRGEQRATRKSGKHKEKSSETACSLNILKTRLAEEHE